MKIAYFDCFSGAAGDMILAALIDAGCPLAPFEAAIGRLGLAGVRLSVSGVKRHGMAARHVQVITAPADRRRHRHLPQIVSMIEASGLPAPVVERSLAVFRRLAEAEAAVHGASVERVHFHEVGADDAIVDIVGACVGLHELGVERVYSSPVPTGSGTVRCEHGVMPVPAPATAHLLRGAPLAACEEPGELTTPTGAALLTTLASDFCPLPAMRLAAVGTGAGTREGQTRPNILRVLLGDIEGARDPATEQRVTVLETQVDDADGQTAAYVTQRLLESGALDAYLTPILMKKGRPGHLLTVISTPDAAAGLERLLLQEGFTLGVRRQDCRRTRLLREVVKVDTPFGPIRVKLGRCGEQTVRVWPEFEDCATAARQHGVSLRTVQDAARGAWHGGRSGGAG